MNKKMVDILSEMKALADAMEQEKDTEKVNEMAAQVKDLKARYETEKAVYEAAKEEVPNEGKKEVKPMNGYDAMMKVISGKALTEVEAAMVTGTDAADGENYLVPEDVRTQINELRRSELSAKELVTVIPTQALTGKFTFEQGAGTGLVNFDDGDDIDDTEQPAFVQKTFTLKNYGKLIPVSNILLEKEKAGLNAYLRAWFVKQAVITENTQIFTALKTGKTAITIANDGEPVWHALQGHINLTLDPAALLGGVIVTNQTGWNVLAGETDGEGLPVLKVNPTKGDTYEFNGLPVIRFSDAQLPNVSGNAPFFVGNLKRGCYFIEGIGYKFAASAHAGFGKNQTQLRVIEAFDVMQADGADANYFYALVNPVQTLPNTPQNPG